MTRSPDFTVIVPAHNEAAVIGTTLAMLMGDGRGAMQVVVVANGCHDDTAEVARRTMPDADVIELAQGGKALALNAGLAAARHETILVVDADVSADRATLDALAAALHQPGVAAASPPATFDTAGADRWVRAYYRVYARHGFFDAGVGGSGIYGLSPEGRARLGRMPPVISDDGYVRALFPLGQQRRVRTHADGSPLLVRVRPPRRVSELVRSEARWRAGDAQVRALVGFDPGDVSPGSGLRSLLRRNDLPWQDRAIYAAVKLLGRARLAWNRAAGTAGNWHRDRSSRGGG